MKTKITLLSALGLGFASLAQAQLPVSTTAENKKVVLEEFTGIHCGYCPDGHKLANQLKANKAEGEVMLINIHTGGYASPGAGEPDYRTADGASIAAISGMNISGYPTGSVNRHLFAGASGFAVSRSAWANYAGQILAQPSYVNIAAASHIDDNRNLTVSVEAYYTDDAPADNKITVALLQDSLWSVQSGASTFYPEMMNTEGKYLHLHMLKDIITDNATGDVVTQSEATSGSKISRTYTYTIPDDYNGEDADLENMHVIVFVAEGDSEIMTGAYSSMQIGGTSIDKVLNSNAVKLYPNPATDKLKVEITAAIAGDATVQIFDVMGRTVMNTTAPVQVGKQSINLDINSLNSGIYNVNIVTQEGVITKKLTVTK